MNTWIRHEFVIDWHESIIWVHVLRNSTCLASCLLHSICVSLVLVKSTEQPTKGIIHKYPEGNFFFLLMADKGFLCFKIYCWSLQILSWEQQLSCPCFPAVTQFDSSQLDFKWISLKPGQTLDFKWISSESGQPSEKEKQVWQQTGCSSAQCHSARFMVMAMLLPSRPSSRHNQRCQLTQLWGIQYVPRPHLNPSQLCAVLQPPHSAGCPLYTLCLYYITFWMIFSACFRSDSRTPNIQIWFLQSIK